jgi:DNA-binding winged helix-turn-helix (wHTH) protein
LAAWRIGLAGPGKSIMQSVAVIGFGQPESLRLLDALKARDRALRLVEAAPGQLAEAGRKGVTAGLIWGAGDSSSKVVEEAADAGMAVVALLPRFDLNRIDPRRGTVEFCFPPLTPEEVLFRLALALERARGQGGPNVLLHGRMAIDLDRYEVTLSGKKVDLTYKEYELLKFLASNPGRVFTREALLRSVWEYDYFGGTRTVDVHVRRLRSKIDDVRNRFIDTVWNVGYRFRSPGEGEGPGQEHA